MPAIRAYSTKTSSSSQRRPRAIAATNVARVSERIGRACCGGVPSGRRISRRRVDGVVCRGTRRTPWEPVLLQLAVALGSPFRPLGMPEMLPANHWIVGRYSPSAAIFLNACSRRTNAGGASTHNHSRSRRHHQRTSHQPTTAAISAAGHRRLTARRQTDLRHRQRSSTREQHGHNRETLQGCHLDTLLTPTLAQTCR
jgi:hypothetical protein